MLASIYGSICKLFLLPFERWFSFWCNTESSTRVNLINPSEVTFPDHISFTQLKTSPYMYYLNMFKSIIKVSICKFHFHESIWNLFSPLSYWRTKKYLYTRPAHCELLLIRSEDHHLQLIRPSQHEPIDFRRYQSSIDQQIDMINRPLPRVLLALVVSGPTDIESSLHHTIDFIVSQRHLGFT